jgi:hypothetical protein
MAHSRLGTIDLVRRTLHAVPSSHSDRHLWREVRLGTARWRIRVSAATGPNRGIGPDLLIDERPLITVSRRDSARCDANVLTDDSRAYRSSQPDVLLHLLRARSIGRDVTTAVTDFLGRPLAAQERATLNARADARWVSLLLLDSVFSIPPQPLYKRDRQAWVSYPCSQHVSQLAQHVEQEHLVAAAQ